MSKSELSNVLTVTERRTLQQMEKVIESGIESFLATGSALKEIRDQQLYREDFKTFEAYIKDKWGFDRTRAYQLIDASGVKQDLSTIGRQIHPKASEIRTERQLRELRTVPSKSLGKVIEKAVEIAIAKGKTLSAEILKEAVGHVLPEEPVESEEEEPEDPFADEPEPETEPEPAGPLAVVPWFKDQLKLVNEIKRNLDRVAELPGNEMIVGRQRTILREIEHIKGGYMAAMPHAICPRCKGTCCPQCGNLGWVNKQRFDELGG